MAGKNEKRTLEIEEMKLERRMYERENMKSTLSTETSTSLGLEAEHSALSKKMMYTLTATLKRGSSIGLDAPPP
jgi:hypothetical protein